MLGEFVTRILVLVLGYAYPAFECFKTVENNRVGIEELRYWCQYWILVAAVTVLERVCDIFISWVPMYWEAKLAIFIYLWYPKTKGSGYVYDVLLKPYLTKHETEIEKNLQVFRTKAWDLLVYYWGNCTDLGQTTFFQILDYIASNVWKLRQPSLQRTESKEAPPPSAPPAPSEPRSGLGIFRRNRSDGRRPPLPPQSPFSAHRAVAQSPASESVQVHLHGQTQFVRTLDPSEMELEMEAESDNGQNPKSKEKEHDLNGDLHMARLKLRRSKGFH